MRLLRCSCLLLSLLTCACALAQAPWPSRPVRLILSNSPGGAPDLVARVTGDMLGRALGQGWVIENRPGGEGVIGADAGAKAAPDGYTFYAATIVAIAVAPHLVKNIPYDSLRDFAPVAMIVDSGPSVVGVHPGIPAKTFAELVALAKSQPGKLSYSVTVAFLGVSAAWMNKLAGIDMVEVNYKDTGQAIQDGVAGRVPVLFNSVGTVLPLARAGKLRMLAVASLKRLPDFPDLPTIAETHPGYESEGWVSLAAPAGTPADIVNRVNREMDRIVKDPQFGKAMQKFVWANLGGARTPAELAVVYRTEREKWGKIIRELGIQPQ